MQKCLQKQLLGRRVSAVTEGLARNVCRISCGPAIALFLRPASTGTMNPMLGDVHRVTQRGPNVARGDAEGQRIGGRQPELVQNHVAHEGAAEVIAELGRDREREFGVLHSASVPALKVSNQAETKPERRIRRRDQRRIRPAGDLAPTA